MAPEITFLTVLPVTDYATNPTSDLAKATTGYKDRNLRFLCLNVTHLQVWGKTSVILDSHS